MLKDREVIVKLINCLGKEEKEKVRILASRCIKKQGIKMKTIEKQSLENYIGYTKLTADGEDNTYYLLFALAASEDENNKPLDRTDIDKKIIALKKARSMSGNQLYKHLEDNNLERITAEEIEKQKNEPMTPARLAWLWLLTRLDDKSMVEPILEEYVSSHTIVNKDEVKEDSASEQTEIAAEKVIEETSSTVAPEQNEDSKKKIKKLQTDNQRLKIKSDNLQKENDAYKRDSKKLKSELSTSQKELESAKKEIEKAKASLKDINLKLTERDEEITKLKNANNELKQEIKNNPRVVLFCRSDEKYVKLPSYKVDVIHTPIALESENLEKCVAIWVITSDYTYAELLTIRKSVKIPTREFYSLNQLIEELEGQA